MGNIEKFINENRAVIDEFLGPNHSIYVAIHLKGALSVVMGKERALNYFEALLSSGMTQLEQNSYMRKLLQELRGNTHTPPHYHMEFGINSNLIIGKERQLFLETMLVEFVKGHKYYYVLDYFKKRKNFWKDEEETN